MITTLELENRIIAEDMEQIYRSRASWDDIMQSGIYITGAAGMIASYFTLFLIFLNEKKDGKINIYAGIRSLEKARLRFGKYSEKPYFHIIGGDVNEPFHGAAPDIIVHAASLASPQYYGTMPVETMLPNIIGTYELLKYASQNKLKSFLFFSSGAVYGSSEGELLTEDRFGGLDYLSKGNEYSESKRCGEALCTAYFREYGVPVRSARINHSYGVTIDYENDSRVFSEFIRNIVRGEDIILKSSGSGIRNFTYLADVVSALFTILLDGNSGEAYNIGAEDNYISIADLAQCLVKLFPEKNLNTVFARRNDPGYTASPEKLTSKICFDKLEALGWSPSYSIEEGFGRAVTYFSELHNGHGS